MNIIEVGKYTYHTPASWDELSKEQYIKICHLLLFYHQMGDKITDIEWRVIREEALTILLDFKRGILRHSAATRAMRKNLTGVQRVTLLNHPDILEWLWSKPSISNYIIKEIRVGNNTYIGPHQNMCDVSGGEFIEMHICSLLYSQTKEEKYLDKLIANAYRPEDTSIDTETSDVYDLRVVNNEFTQEKREKIFENIPPAQKLAIWLQFTCQLEAFTNQHTVFFSKVKKEGNSDLESYYYLIKNVSGGKFGSYEETRKVRAHLLFKEIEDSMDHAEEVKRVNKKRK